MSSRFESHDTDLVAYILEFKGIKLLGTRLTGDQVYFMLDIDEPQGEFYQLDFHNADMARFASRRKSLVDLAYRRRRGARG
jgi:hypothetical protein